MTVFQALFIKLLPMYLLILLGFTAGKTKKINADSIAILLIYFIIPIVIFMGALSTPLTLSRILIPLFVAIFCVSMSFIFRGLNFSTLSANRLGIWSYACGSGNSGYFGIPLTFFLLGPDHVGIAILVALGFIIFESTFGFYFVARAHHTAHESFMKLVKLPSMWAFLAAVILQKSGVQGLNDNWKDLYQGFRGCYSILGMIMLGLGIAHLKSFKINWRLVLRIFSFKFTLVPLSMTGFLWLNKTHLNFFDTDVSKVLFLMSLVPLPANSVAFAVNLKTDPEETAMIVLLSTVFALFFIPCVWSFWYNL